MFNPPDIRKDFPVLEKYVYLDSAATTQTPRQVVEAMCDYFYNYAANHGRGAHRLARETTNHYEDAREAVAGFLCGEYEHTIFTRNTTESINMVALGLDWEAGDHVVTTHVEHHSNLLPWLSLKEKGVEITAVTPNPDGTVDPKDIDSAITEQTKLVALTHVSNVFGSVMDVEEITKIAHRNGCMSLVDAAQSVGHMPFDVKKIDCDFMAVSGHKGMLGPQGTGVLYLKDTDSIKPVYLGGGTIYAMTGDDYKLEDAPGRFEYGTPNIPGVIGLGRSVEYVKSLGVEDIQRHEEALGRDAAKRLSEIDKVEVYGPQDRAAVVPFNVVGLNSHDVAMILDETRKICVRSGYHCAIPSVNFLKVEGTIRASFGAYNLTEEVDLLVDTVEQIATTLT
ncbi:MAG: cysteine desulfurase [ANME-2 cluster archaeon]|nr:cysteine desulfurase [ANME-2 cluster archaeon]MBC2702830.1 cysteine desulfurase [ANME-2 cluster archaeon]MBC2708049.1 cysteine desulfurase [ANME-2 cluster archaeon]MBC2747773.1 cysteine desulfurase [ANME-2 cluster archaeon]MBC2763284.1 cysteine desulfurase [ANME-2 cluster archaeon]